MTRTQRSFEIAKRSWAVLRSERCLVWFPVLSMLASVVVVATFALLIFASDGSGDGFELGAMGYVLVAAAYVALSFVQVYFLGALVAAADRRLRGAEASVAQGIAAANARLHRLLPWAVLTATVSIVLKQVERQGLLGRIVGAVLGIAWALLTFLTVPILMLEDVPIRVALRRSKTLFTGTWGENAIGQAGLGLVGMLVMVPGMLLIAGAAALGSSAAGVVVLAIPGVVALVAAAAAIGAMSGIYRTALYRYATSGEIPTGFEGAGLDSAFEPKRGDGGGFGGFNGGFGGFTR